MRVIFEKARESRKWDRINVNPPYRCRSSASCTSTR